MKKIEEPKKKAAVMRVYGAYSYDSYGDPSGTADLVKHVTDWQEMTFSEFEELRRSLHHADTRDYRHLLIEQMDGIFIANTVNDYRAFIKKEEAKRAEMQAEYERRQAESKAKRELKKLEKIAKDKEKFKQLASTMGLKVVDA